MDNEKFAVCGMLITPDALDDVEQISLFMPNETIQKLTTVSKEKATDFNVEIVSRLMFTVISPECFGLDLDVDSRANKRFLKSKETIK